MTYDVKSTVAFLKILRSFSTVGGQIANHRLKTGFPVECRNFGGVSNICMENLVSDGSENLKTKFFRPGFWEVSVLDGVCFEGVKKENAFLDGRL